MQKFSKFLIEHKILIISLIVVLLVVSCIGLLFIKTNSDILSYLPPDSDTAVGKDVLFEKFNIEGDCSIIVKGVDEALIKEIVADAEGREFVSQIAWIGSFDMIKEQLKDPNLPAMEREILEQSYKKSVLKYTSTAKDGAQMLKISIYVSQPTSSKVVMNYIDELEGKLKSAESSGKLDEFAMGGMAVNSRNMLKSSLGEIPMYLVIAIVIMSIILLLTTKSWLEPFIFLATLGLSLLFNMGSNFIFGEISTITYSASTILQLALAMDYSIFLMHSYYDEKGKSPLITPKDAMMQALPKTLKSVTASALTTVGGFIALFAMEFRMGIDLGAVLAKGVILSLLTVITLQPVLILALSKPIEKTTHRYIKPTLKRPQKFACKFAVPIVVLACLLVVPTLIGQFKVPLSYITMTKPSKEISETQAMMNDGSNQLIVVAPMTAVYSKHYDFMDEVQKIDEVTDVFSAYSLLPEDKYQLITLFRPEIMEMLQKTFFKGGYSLYLFEISAPIESQACYDTIERIHSLADTNFGADQAYVTGLGQGAKDLAAVTPNDFLKVSLISALIILIILLVSYKEVWLSLILLLVIELGIWINLSIVTLSGLSINFMSYLIISSVQLGATVDYAILVASKYKQEKADGERNEIEAIKKAVSKASPSILVSALVLICVCVAVFFVTSNLIIGQITLLIAAGAAMSTFLVMFLLPAVLTVKARISNRSNGKRLAKAGLGDMDATSPITDEI